MILVVGEGFIPKTPRELLIALFIVGPFLLFGEGIFEALIYGIGWGVILIATLGRVRASWKLESKGGPWHGFLQQPDGSYLASVRALGIVGAGVFVLGFVAMAVWATR